MAGFYLTLLVLGMALIIFAVFIVVIVIAATTASVSLGGMAASVLVKDPKAKAVALMTSGSVALLALSWVFPVIILFVNADLLFAATIVTACMSAVAAVLSVVCIVKTLRLEQEIKTVVKVLIIVLLSFVVVFSILTVAAAGFGLYFLSLMSAETVAGA